MLDVVLATAGLLAVGVGVSMRAIRSLPLSPPLLGLAAGALIGPLGLAAAEIPPADHQRVLETATRLLLAVALMGIALRYPGREAWSRRSPVALLLVAVMPAMAVATAALAGATLGVPLALAAAVGAALTPTDPVLASSVVTGAPAERDIPARLRQVLSLESGANDGLAILLTLLAVALATGRSVPGELGLGLLEVALGLVLGAAIGTAAGWLLHLARRRHDVEASAVTLFALVLAATVLGVVALLGGNEVLAVFAAGLAYNRMLSGPERVEEDEIDEGLNQFLVLPVFVLFGMVLPWEGWRELGWAGVTFAVLVLVLRRLPWVLLLQRPLGLTLPDALWLGWFGPIGVAALFYLGFLHAHGVTDPVVWEAGTLVVAASTLAHGVTAAPGRRRYARARERRGRRAHGPRPDAQRPDPGREAR